MRPTNSQQCSTGIPCTTESSLPEVSTLGEDEESGDDEVEAPIELMSRDEPHNHRHREFYHQELPKPERLVDQRVPSEAT